MVTRNFAFTVLFVLGLTACASTSQPATEAQRPDALQVVTRENTYVLSVPASRLVMYIPRGKLAPTTNPLGGAANNPRYFYFVDRPFNVSGWFEPAQKFRGMQKWWDDETRGWSRAGLPNPVNVAFTKIEGWDAVIYDLPVPNGNNSHIRAHWVQVGTWIDIHLSMTSSRPSTEVRSWLETFLKAVVVRERT
jgi:hypothetical protein